MSYRQTKRMGQEVEDQVRFLTISWTVERHSDVLWILFQCGACVLYSTTTTWLRLYTAVEWHVIQILSYLATHRPVIIMACTVNSYYLHRKFRSLILKIIQLGNCRPFQKISKRLSEFGNARLNNPWTVHTLMLSNVHVDRKWYDGYKQSQIHTR